ncbi:MAG: UBP-type zinc finger domain-containing protein [Bacteroidota bacterium]
MVLPKTCEHLKGFEVKFKAEKYECEECVKTGDQWVHLRTCQECGTTLCCDSSPNQHASKHAKNHPEHNVIISAESGENWAWCYDDNSMVRY